MKILPHKAITLMELLIALILISVVILSFSSIDTFSRGQVTSAERRTKMQNEASYIVEHMKTTMMNTVGNTHNATDAPVQILSAGPTIQFLAFFTGVNWSAYGFNSDSYQLSYCPAFLLALTKCDNSVPKTSLGNKTAYFTPNLAGNSVSVGIVECWDPDNAGLVPPYGTPDNPCVIMNTSIPLPYVSTN